MVKGLIFIKHTDLDYALKKLGWKVFETNRGIYRKATTADACVPTGMTKVKCEVCGKTLTEDNIGAFTPKGATCNDFACVMGTLLREKTAGLQRGDGGEG